MLRSIPRPLTPAAVAAGGTQVVTVYFEDPHARPSLVNAAVKKGLWRYARKFAAAAVDYCQQHTV